MPKEKKIDEIQRLCDEAGISMTEVFRKADIPYSTVTNWKRKEPAAFNTYDALIETIKKMKSVKASTPVEEVSE